MLTSTAEPVAELDREDFVRVGPAASYLKCGERWLRDGCNSGKFPHHRMGNRLVFSRKDLAEIAALMHQPPRPRSRRSRTARKRA
ncbi:helix-turn-helix domain-containing protein [Streptomyces sp. NPDC004728]|uniref:helix-turn-helix domain-containing protein n=1 Tax=Streptomyces sp. NPDC004728 TaxID=3154289 RepID=UPI0033A4A0E3